MIIIKTKKRRTLPAWNVGEVDARTEHLASITNHSLLAEDFPPSSSSERELYI